jgi:phospholipid transport system substrate-binding protein
MARARAILTMTVMIGLQLVPLRAGADQARDQVQATVDQVLEVLSDPGLAGAQHTAARRAKIRTIVLGRFGFEEMAKRSLGATWYQRRPAEQKQFVDLFTDLLERSYISRIESYKGEKIVYPGESIQGDRAEVNSVILSHGDRSTIDYRLVRVDDGWEVYDLVIDGISLVNNYRMQFAHIIGQSGYDGLLTKMRAKQEAEEESDRDLAAPPVQ